MYIGVNVKYPLFSSIFSTDFQKNNQVSNFMKIRPVEAEVFHADGQKDTDRHDETNSLFSQLRERAKKNQIVRETFGCR